MSHNARRVVDMLEDDLHKIVEKGDISPQDLEMLKNASKTMYYLSVYCAMEDGGEEPYYDDGYSGRGRRRNSIGQYSGDYSGTRYYPDATYRANSRSRYSGGSYEDHKMEKRKMLEEMMANARNESEREVFRNQIMELDRM